ncbi:hypothetical protein, partial [Nitratidesulfovibrio liaohensis]|uniref:hypothetical protein n=1 Tax=Nitratidesulfovibrio liaohensis TaxID=2604158 RepID=UPI001421EC69
MTASFSPDDRAHSPVAPAIHPLVHLLATGAALPGAPGVPRLPVDAELPHLLGVLADGVRAVLQAL